MFACWVAFPLLLALPAYGCGALVEYAAGRLLPLTVLLPCGVALTIGALDLLTRSTSTVALAIPVVCALTAGGVVLRPPWRHRTTAWALVPASVVFVVYAAPIVLSGTATWAGYVKLDDTATWLALVDRTLTAGHTLAGLSPSTYTDTLAAYLTNGYPVGSFLPLGLGRTFLGEDIAWLTNPWMAFMAGMLALSLYRIAWLALGARIARWQTATIAILAAQPALLYGYYLWGGMKEMAGAMLVAAFASALSLVWEPEPRTCSPQTVRRAFSARLPHAYDVRRIRATIPALVVLWALLAALSTGGLVWVVPGGVLALSLLALSCGMRMPSPRFVFAAAAICGVAAYLALRPGGFVERNKAVLTGGNELGNLIAPLHLRQIVGIWPAGDFRAMPAHVTVTSLLIALTALLAAGGLAMALRRTQRALILYALCSLAGALLVFWVGSPWLAGKALASASPAVVLLALVACAMTLDWGRHKNDGLDRARRRRDELHREYRRRDGLHHKQGGPRILTRGHLRQRALDLATGAPVATETPVATGTAIPTAAPVATAAAIPTAAPVATAAAVVAAAAIAAGIVWSNVLGYHAVSLAPRAQFAELATIGSRIAGEGPTLMTDFSPFGARHFLREAQPESASELRSRPDQLRSGKILPPGAIADIDRFPLATLLVYRTLVLRRSPVASRPPTPFEPILRGRYWEVWQRPSESSARVLAHLPLGNAVAPGGVPPCDAVLGLARIPGTIALLAPPVENPLVVPVGEGIHPRRWSDNSEHLRLAGAGSARVFVTVPHPGRYGLWLGGSMSGPVAIAVNGVPVGTVRYEVQEDGQYVPFGTVSLERGRYEVSIAYDGGDWRPGSGGPPATVGPLVLRREAPEPPPLRVRPAAARSLCGRTLDWAEALSG